MVCGSLLFGAFIFCSTAALPAQEPVRNYSLQPVDVPPAIVLKAQDRISTEWFLTFGKPGDCEDCGRYFMEPGFFSKAACEARARDLYAKFNRSDRYQHQCQVKN